MQLYLHPLALRELIVRGVTRVRQVFQVPPQLQNLWGKLRDSRSRRVLAVRLRLLKQRELLLQHALQERLFRVPVRGQRVVQLRDPHAEERLLAVLNLRSVFPLEVLLDPLHLRRVVCLDRLYQVRPVVPQLPGRGVLPGLAQLFRLLAQGGD
eukprot:30886-Pelagococcus_subviridis.AAC.13